VRVAIAGEEPARGESNSLRAAANGLHGGTRETGEYRYYCALLNTARPNAARAAPWSLAGVAAVVITAAVFSQRRERMRISEPPRRGQHHRRNHPHNARRRRLRG